MNPSQIYAQNQAQMNNAAAQGNVAQGQYSQTMAGAQTAQQNYQNYQQQMPDLGNVYGQNVQSAENNYGVDPAKLLAANQGLAATQATMNNLPQAIQQGANGRGLTGAQEANRYTQGAQNLQTSLGDQAAGVQAYQSSLQNALNQAGQQTQFTGQTQQQELTALSTEYSQYQQQEALAQNQLQYYRTLQQNGIQLDVGEQTAQAAAATAAAQAQMAQAQLSQAATARMLANANLSQLNSNGSNGNMMANGQPRFPAMSAPASNTGVMGDLEAFLQSLIHLNPTTNFGQLGQNATSLLGELSHLL